MLTQIKTFSALLLVASCTIAASHAIPLIVTREPYEATTTTTTAPPTSPPPTITTTTTRVQQPVNWYGDAVGSEAEYRRVLNTLRRQAELAPIVENRANYVPHDADMNEILALIEKSEQQQQEQQQQQQQRAPSSLDPLLSLSVAPQELAPVSRIEHRQRHPPPHHHHPNHPHHHPHNHPHTSSTTDSSSTTSSSQVSTLALEEPKSEVGGECAICLEDIKRGQLETRLRCGHKYHLQCIDQWLGDGTYRRSCPQCRKSEFRDLLDLTRAVE